MKTILAYGFIGLIFLSPTAWCMYWSYKQEQRQKEKILMYQKDSIELFRLKTAMALGGIDDFIEREDGTVEVKMLKP